MFSFWSRIRESTPEEALEAVRNGALLIDVRNPSEFRSGHAEGARSVPLSTLAESADTLPRDRPLQLICASGNRSRTAARVLEKSGFANVTSVRGGTTAWASRGLPMAHR